MDDGELSSISKPPTFKQNTGVADGGQSLRKHCRQGTQGNLRYLHSCPIIHVSPQHFRSQERIFLHDSASYLDIILTVYFRINGFVAHLSLLH